jgi:hypothetical protein|tara:strand:+ start:281 stop:808 length:528 start_codon:yes stop_codon:yes gene_type:complete
MSKRFHDWYKMQKDVQGWKTIPPDTVLANILAPMDMSLNFNYSHYSIKKLLNAFECMPSHQADLYIITEIELSKLRLEELFTLYQDCYNKSKRGIYIAALSYYLSPLSFDETLSRTYSENIDTIFRKNCSFADRIENLSTVIDYPLQLAHQQDYMIEGSNYIFVHPNIKYFLWKD